MRPARPDSLPRRSRSEAFRCPALTRLVARVLVLGWLGGLAAAQGVDRPRASATRTAVPPGIDGRLDDPVWADATPIGDLTQIEPRLGEPASERTEVRFLYDDDHLYLAIRCYDSHPGGIVTTTRERDAFLDSDDRVELVFDTFLDRRNAFFFQINAGGSKGDALVTNNGADFNKPWDGIWEGKSSVDGEGWSAELALPFKTFNFEPGLSTWGFNIARIIGRKRETARWANVTRENGLFFLFGAGDLGGLEGLRQGLGLDVSPFAVGNWIADDADPDSHVLGDVGVDAFYKLTPSLTLSLTANTDFAETEVDERQINLTRFSLFFPERRDFFLQDAGVFEFANLENQLIPFFSRTIGLDGDGGEVPILGGAKLTGRAGEYSVGVLDVQTDREGELDAQNLFVGRVTRNVGEQSTVGAIFTHGNPTGGPDNQVYGLDYNFRTSDFRGHRNLRSSLWALRSETTGLVGEDAAFGASLQSPGDVFSWNLGFLEIQENFEPALGFVPRRDIRNYEGGFTWSPRVDDVIRNLEFGVEADYVTGTDDELRTREVELQPLGLFFESGETLRFEIKDVRDVLDEEFEIVDGVAIPAGVYDWTRVRLEAGTAVKRDVSAELSVEVGDFFDGDRQSYGGLVNWRPGPLFTAVLAYQRNEVSLAAGAFTTDLARLAANFSFTPDLSWNNFLQWDTESDSIGVNSRLRWIPEPGQEVFLVFNETLERADGSTSPVFQEVAVKLVYTFRL